jgi:DNA polymerase delta subunit OB-fold domain
VRTHDISVIRRVASRWSTWAALKCHDQQRRHCYRRAQRRPSSLGKPKSHIVTSTQISTSFASGSCGTWWKKLPLANGTILRVPVLTAFYSDYGLTLAVGSPRLVQRVLEVTKGHLCYIIGTVYMDMPLKPNVMEDLTRDVCALPPHVLLPTELGTR